MQNNDKKVLLRISNLKQYFPLKGGGFVKANDGITLDIYEGETFGLVGESGCGKSTLGRTILQLYHQTYGRTMYYGRSLDDLAPKYVIDTVKNLKSRRAKLKEREARRDKLEAEYAKLSEKEQYAKHGELDAARKLAEDSLLDITKIVGGFLVVDNLDPVIAVYTKDYHIARKMSALEEKRQSLMVDVDDAKYAKKTAEEAGKAPKEGQLQKAEERLKRCDDQIAAHARRNTPQNDEIANIIEHFVQAERMAQIHADGSENIERARVAAFRQLLHFLELFRRRQAFRQCDASRRSQLYDGILREIFAAHAKVAGPFIAHGVFVQVGRRKGKFADPAEQVALTVDITDRLARAHRKPHHAACAEAHRPCERGHVAIVGDDDGHIAELLCGAVEDGLDLLAAAARHLEEDGGDHRGVADEHACG